MAVRSRWVATFNFSTATVTTAYTVPVDRTFIAKRIIVLNRTAAALSYSLYAPSSSISSAFRWKVPIPANTVHDFETWMVWHPLKVLAVSQDTLPVGTLTVQVHGSLLSGAPA